MDQRRIRALYPGRGYKGGVKVRAGQQQLLCAPKAQKPDTQAPYVHHSLDRSPTDLN